MMKFYISIFFISLLNLLGDIHTPWVKEKALDYRLFFSNYNCPEEFKEYYKNKEYNKVVWLAKKLYPNLQRNYNKLKVREMLFFAYQELGDYRKAFAAYQNFEGDIKILDKDKKLFSAQQYDAIKKLKGKDIDFDLLVDIYRQVIDFNGEEVPKLWSELAQIYSAKGKESNAVEAYKNLITLYRYSPEAKTAHALFLKVYTDRVKTIDDINMRYFFNKYFSRIYTRSAYLTKLPKNAQPWSQEALILKPLNIWSNYSLVDGGQQYFLNEKFFGSARAYKKIYSQSKVRINQAFAKFNEAEALFFGGRYNDAINEFSFFVKAYSDFIEASRIADIRDGKVIPYQFVKKAWDVDEYLLEANGLLSSSSYLYAGDSYYREQKYEAAAEAYEVLSSLSPRKSHNEKQARLLAADSWLLAGNYVKAYNTYRQALPQTKNGTEQYEEVLKVMFNIVDEVYRIHRDADVQAVESLQNNFKTTGIISKVLVSKVGNLRDIDKKSAEGVTNIFEKRGVVSNFFYEAVENLSSLLFFYEDIDLLSVSNPQLFDKENIFYLHESLINLVPFHPRIPEYFRRLASLHIEKYNASGAQEDDVQDAIKTLNKMIKAYREQDDFLNEGKGRVDLAEVYFLYLRGNGDADKVDNAKIQLEYFIKENSLHPNTIDAQILLGMIDEWKAKHLYNLAKFYEDETIFKVRFWPFPLSHEKLFERLSVAKRYLAEILVEYPNSKIVEKARELKGKIDKIIKQRNEYSKVNTKVI